MSKKPDSMPSSSMSEKIMHTERVGKEQPQGVPPAPDYFGEAKKVVKGEFPLSAYEGEEDSDSHMTPPEKELEVIASDQLNPEELLLQQEAEEKEEPEEEIPHTGEDRYSQMAREANVPDEEVSAPTLPKNTPSFTIGEKPEPAPKYQKGEVHSSPTSRREMEGLHKGVSKLTQGSMESGYFRARQPHTKGKESGKRAHREGDIPKENF